jgi:hypothetical protein
MVLKTVVSQQLLPDIHGGMVPACEIMQVNSAGICGQTGADQTAVLKIRCKKVTQRFSPASLFSIRFVQSSQNLFSSLSIAHKYCSRTVNAFSSGPPSLIRKVLLISLGITMLIFVR